MVRSFSAAISRVKAVRKLTSIKAGYWHLEAGKDLGKKNTSSASLSYLYPLYV
jgi:hypothetical protein